MSRKKGLGRGLDSLLQVKKEINTLDTTQGGKLDTSPQKLPMDVIHRGAYQPRRSIDPSEISSLAESIKSVGLIQPIIVRSTGDEQYEIIAGERRWHAAQEAGLTEIPVIIREIDDKTAAAVALVENIQRQDLNAIEEANGMQKLVNDFNLTHLQVASLLGKSRSAVSNLMRLLELSEAVKTLVENRQLEMGHARALLALPASQQITVAQQAIKQQWSARQVELTVKNLLREVIEPTKATDSDTMLLQDQLSQILGTSVKIDHRTNGSGKVVVPYYSLDQLQGIISKIQ